MPGVLLRALSEYNFVGSPLWRTSDGKDLVRVELTFHKKLPTPRVYKKGAESRRQLAPPAGEWPRQPAPARRPPRREPTQMERETLPPPPPPQTTVQTPHQITRPRYKTTATITASPTITRPAPAPASPVTPPPKKARKESPAPERPIQYCSYHYEEEYSIHEKYDLQDGLSNRLHGHDVAIIKAQRIPEEDEKMNIDLPAYFLHRTWKKDWLFIKGPTSKYHHEEFYTKMEELAKSGKPQTNIISWFGFLERSCGDARGKFQFVRVEPR